jgi:hypothetical protein
LSLPERLNPGGLAAGKSIETRILLCGLCEAAVHVVSMNDSFADFRNIPLAAAILSRGGDPYMSNLNPAFTYPLVRLWLSTKLLLDAQFMVFASGMHALPFAKHAGSDLRLNGETTQPRSLLAFHAHVRSLPF